MYKTVRHGENSLQYTILPQTEEVLSNSGLKGKGRDYSPSIHVRRSRRKFTLNYALLILVGIAVGLALAAVPLYVMHGYAMHARRNHQDGREIITNSPLTPTGREIVKSRKKELKLTPELISTIQSILEIINTSTTSSSTSSTTTSTTTVPPVVTERAATPWTMPALRAWKSSTASTTTKPEPTIDDQRIPLVGTPSGSIRILDRYSAKVWKDVFVTMSPEPVTIKNILKPYTEKIGTVSPKIFDDIVVTFKTTTVRPTQEMATKLKDLKDAILSVDDDDDFKESLEVDEVFSLPPLKPEGSDSDEVTVSKAGDWYAARWPFVDTSSYFQWSGYSPGDNLLLPLLVATLSSIALVLLLAIAVRRRKRMQANGGVSALSVEAQADDNTNLLTAENPEDVEGEE